jgi:nitrogen regulatory protein PII-like uncharacterized protein
MKSISNESHEVLGVSPDEVKGFSIEEIKNFIRKIQEGVQGEKLSEEEIEDSALQIWHDANQ